MTRAERIAMEAYPPETKKIIQLLPKDWNKPSRDAFLKGYEQAEKDLIEHIREQIKTWMPQRDGDEHTEGKRLAFRSVLILLQEMEEEK